MRARRTLIIGFGAGLLVLAALRLFVLEIDRVSSASMAPSLVVGDWLLVSRLGGAPARGDIVVFTAPSGEKMVKRVLGLPGDRVEDTGRFFQINGEILPEEELKTASLDSNGDEATLPIPMHDQSIFEEHLEQRHWRIARIREGSHHPAAWTVPANSYFVIGDNRNASFDSRDASIGMIPRTAVSGHVVRVLFSRGPDGWRPRTWLPVP